MTTVSSILAWRIPWTEEPGGVQSMGLQRVRHDWATKHSTILASLISFWKHIDSHTKKIHFSGMVNTITNSYSLLSGDTTFRRKEGARSFQVQGASLHHLSLNLRKEKDEEGKFIIDQSCHFCNVPSVEFHTTQIPKEGDRKRNIWQRSW